MPRFFAPQKAHRADKSAAAMLTDLSQRYGMAENRRDNRCHLEEASMADNSTDPVAIWQNMMGEMEKGFNAFATKAMEAPEFSKVVNQVGGVSAGAQKQLGDKMEKQLLHMNLPSRPQIVSIAQGLAASEGQLKRNKARLQQGHSN